MSAQTETDRVIFDDDMSWSEDETQIIKIQEETLSLREFIESGLFNQFMNHGLFANEHVNKVYDISYHNDGRTGHSLMPALVGTLEDMKKKEFRDLLTECELYCEKMRDYEKVRIYVFLMDNSYEIWDRNCASVDEFFERHDYLKRKSIMYDIFDSKHVGHWEYNRIMSGKKRQEENDENQYASLVECVEGLIDSFEKENAQ